MASVEVARAEAISIADDVRAVGSLQSTQGVVIRPEASGRIAQLGFEQGARVRRGQLLVQLDDTLQRAQLQQAEAQASIARTNLARSRELLAAAEAGDADALCEVGIVLMSNAVRKKEQKRAFDFLKRAAQQHHPRALWALGSCHQLGIGTPKDLAEAVRSYAEAAALGEHESQHRLGLILASGEGGIAVDMPRAVRCWTQAAQANNAKAMLALGELYAHGSAEHHVPTDRRLALHWLRRAAASPDALTAAIAAQAIARLEGTDQPGLQE